jgi:hypothetical protein
MKRLTLNELIQKVEDIIGIYVYDTRIIVYSLDRFQYCWRFKIVDNWQKWMSKGYKSDFEGNTPEEAIEAFLMYIEYHEIDPATLRENFNEKNKTLHNSKRKK